MNFSNKYLKYKKKYLELKNNINGGTKLDYLLSTNSSNIIKKNIFNNLVMF